MPTNLYGPGDNFHPENSHVLPALMRRLDEAAQNSTDEVTIWGTGTPMREFLHVDDMAAASLHILNIDQSLYQQATEPMLSHINVGTGTDVTIRELAETIAKVVGYKGQLAFDTSKPDGTPRKLLDVSRLADLGWQSSISLEDGIRQTYAWYKQQTSSGLREK
jgi:nucleoside-diphosphate-sugar epimerase